MRFEFHPEALAEFEAAADFYAERQAGLELRFVDAIHSAVPASCLLLTPLRFVWAGVTPREAIGGRGR